MPTLLNSGSDEVNDPTTLQPGTLREAVGEYRVGDSGLWSVRGRTRMGGVSTTLDGLYAVGLDSGGDYILAQTGASYCSAAINDPMTFTTLAGCGSAASPPVGTHYANRHYVVNGATNIVVEYVSGLTSRSVGMAAATGVPTVVNHGSGSMSVTSSLQYWVTEYDNTRGIESLAGATVSIGSFTGAAGVTVTITGASQNPNMTHWRVYRSADGGAFPTGGLLGTVAAAASPVTFSDTNSATGEVEAPVYGNVSINGLDFDRDERPPVLSVIGGPFEDSLVGIAAGDLRSIRFTPAGYPESWPSIFEIPLQTHRHDQGTALAVLNSQLGVFTRDTVHRITRLPREVDSAFAAGEAISLVTDERGSISRRGVAAFTLPGVGQLLAFVTRDGVWATNLAPSMQVPLTDRMDWAGRVNVAELSSARLVNDPANRRLVFLYVGAGETTAERVTYLDYQTGTIRLTHPDHGALVDGVLAPYQGALTLFTGDSREGNGYVYTEGTKDTDDSDFLAADGSIAGAVHLGDLFPAGVMGERKMGVASWRHGPMTGRVTHSFYLNGGATPIDTIPDFSSEETTDIGLERVVNAFSLRLYWTTTTPFRVAWVEVEGLESAPLHGEGA